MMISLVLFDSLGFLLGRGELGGFGELIELGFDHHEEFLEVRPFLGRDRGPGEAHAVQVELFAQVGCGVGLEVDLVEDDEDLLPGYVHRSEEADAFSDLDPHGEEGVRCVHEEDDHVGALEVLEVDLEALDEPGVEVDDESDGVDEEEGGLPVHEPSLVLAAQGGEGLVAHQLTISRERVKEAGLPGVVVAGYADGGEAEASPLMDPLALLNQELLDLPLDGGLAPGELPHLAVECVLPHAPEEGSVVVEPEVGLELEVGGELLEPRSFDLELAQGV